MDRRAGFTLIEIMVTLAILAILMGVAVASYQNYSVRARVTECLALVAPAKLAVTEAATSLRQLPQDQQQANIEPNQITSSPYCDGLDYDGTRLRVEIDESAVGAAPSDTIELDLKPQLGNGHISWDCTAGSTSTGAMQYLPAPCRNN